MIRSRMLQIATQEGLKVNDIAMEALIESCNSDIRLVLNTLQVRVVQHSATTHRLTSMRRAQMRRLNSDTLQFDDVKSTATKDLELGAFNATDKCVACDAWCLCLRLHSAQAHVRGRAHAHQRAREPGVPGLGHHPAVHSGTTCFVSEPSLTAS